MFLTALQIITSVFAILFIILFFRTYNWKKLKLQWQSAVDAGAKKYKFVAKVAELKNRGLTEFHFGSISVWAMNQDQANLKHRIALVKLKAQERDKAAQRKTQRDQMYKGGKSNRKAKQTAL